jgi:ubiquinone/menaquinone biosynthesis C-methylase UbiE
VISDDVALLQCPRGCTDDIVYSGDARDEIFTNGELGCKGCGTAWPFRGGVADFVDEEHVGNRDSWNRLLYDWAAPFHDAAVTWLLPFLQLKTEGAMRSAYMRKLELDRIDRRRTPLRILEVGAGTGANIPLVDKFLKPMVRPEYWAADLSDGMLDRCRATHGTLRSDPIRYVRADAHTLPFRDHTFDRVFHVGGIAGYSDPPKALAEMARVAKPDTPIVVVDEQLCEDAWLLQKLVFGLFALVAPEHGAPKIEDLPAGYRDRHVEQISRFYYALTFRMSGKKLEGAGSMDPALLRQTGETVEFFLKDLDP